MTKRTLHQRSTASPAPSTVSLTTRPLAMPTPAPSQSTPSSTSSPQSFAKPYPPGHTSYPSTPISATGPARNPLHPSVIPLLDPTFIQLYNNHIATAPPPSKDINTVRQQYSSLYRYATQDATGVGGIGETTVPGWKKYEGEIGVRVYVPPETGPIETKGDASGEKGEVKRKVWPVHFNFHGGGWAVGDLETDAHLCHHICATVPCCVIDVDYRLIPEYPFPIGIMDSLSAVIHVLTNHKTFSIDPDNVTLGGESSGATIALILNHLFRDSGGKWADKIKGVIVGTPTISDVKKYATPEMSPWPSMRELAETAPLLNWEKLKWFDTFKWMSLGSSNFGTNQREKRQDISWFADAMQAPDFEGLAPLTFVGVAEVDPLRDEALAYAERVREKGNRVVVKRYEGVPHGFMRMDRVLRQGREYVLDVIGCVRECLYKDGQGQAGKEAEEAKGDEEMKDA